MIRAWPGTGIVSLLGVGLSGWSVLSHLPWTIVSGVVAAAVLGVALTFPHTPQPQPNRSAFLRLGDNCSNITLDQIYSTADDFVSVDGKVAGLSARRVRHRPQG